ncbi:unnamed protein product [Rangifer tarandus platyrhynchus]|uniref:Uncharacterized protein n=1 Tax=Rangifer tarandus platyrhynchus TaxID=3082113 RepID=A0ABN8ZFA4_RANTA|nr:unnamed protein product [Rangifer tarandus platyrhynchus]
MVGITALRQKGAPLGPGQPSTGPGRDVRAEPALGQGLRGAGRPLLAAARRSPRRSRGCWGPAPARPEAPGTRRWCGGGKSGERGGVRVPSGGQATPPPPPEASPARSSPGACGAPSPRARLRRAPRRPGSYPKPSRRRSPPSSLSSRGLRRRSSWEGGSDRWLLPGGVWGPRAEREEPPSGASAAGGGAGAREGAGRLGPGRARGRGPSGVGAEAWGCDGKCAGGGLAPGEGEQRPAPFRAPPPRTPGQSRPGGLAKDRGTRVAVPPPRGVES